ncbi:prolyl oligopeptidase family serine peptidase [Microbacterium aoyamense]|uniref:Prolyl oligopeptidase family serine peptidase n=1 Tax=Microbacterium aoyamense TaxID=344166 RepID=A0ABP5BA95_9MICO|nr:prolyl oligopeptidase family serine peptidase [Microbacterium aoyamense]
MDAIPAELDHALARRFETPFLLTVRPAAGPDDVALLIEDHPDGSRARLWRAGDEPSALLPFAVGVGAILTPDAKWVIDLDDGGGSEVGTLVAVSVDGERVVDLTPGRLPFVLRGLEAAHDGSAIVVTVVDEDGFHVLVIPAAPWGPPRTVYSSPIEAWYGQISPDGSLVSVDTTDHNPGIRRAALTVVEAESGEVVGVLDDLPAGPVRGVRFSAVADDPRILVNTERTGFARPAIWNHTTGERRDFALADLSGEVIPLDWHASSGRVLALHVEDGIHRLLELHEASDEVRVVAEGGAFANPDVADLHPFQWASSFAPDGAIRVVRSDWATPLSILQDDGDRLTELVAPAAVPGGRPLASSMVTSADGTRVQLWVGRPDGEALGTVLDIHGGPNLVWVDEYSPSAQAWMDAGFAYAALNYRGSVTFGQAFREGFWGTGGDREIEDVAAAIEHLRAQGLGDPASTFITGASFGGHMTLLSVGRLPDLFAGGLAHVAVADWSAAIAEMNPAVRSVWTTWVPPEMVERYSAISYLDDVTASVWINQGALDTRTPIVGVQRFVDGLGDRGGDVVMDVFDGGHEPTGLQNLEHDQRRMTELALRTLAGRRWNH